MSDTFTCPFCQCTFPLIPSTISKYYPCFETAHFNGTVESKFLLTFIKCPQCDEYTVKIIGIGEKVKSNTPINIRPISNAKQFPDYIPQAIREDYEEAYAIVNLSPKSSATLARRCLQGMIHDFWNIHGKNLNAEITALESLISPIQWKVLDGIRNLGNIGAHMEHDINKIIDIDPDESIKLLKVIEKLIHDWYIDRYETERLYEEVINISDEKQIQRKSNE